MIVSLEAIFLSTFVMISQNRADAKRQVIADQQWQTVKEEDGQNEELLELSRQIPDLTRRFTQKRLRDRQRKARRRSATGRARLRLDSLKRWARDIRLTPPASAVRRTLRRGRLTRGQLLAARTVAVAAVWHRRRAGFAVQTSAPNGR